MIIKVEVFRPTRMTVGYYTVADSDITVQERNAQVNSFVKEQLPSIEIDYPEATEVRWEYTDIGQGHYLMKLDGRWTTV